MALLDFLKNKKEQDNAREKKASRSASVTKKVAAPKTEKAEKVAKTPKTPKAPSASIATGKFSYDVVNEPHISEKASYLAEDNKYVFKVYSNSNKPQIKAAVEGIYNVNVVSVNIVKTPKKKRRIGKVQGYKKGYTKAIVTVKEGQKIEIF